MKGPELPALPERLQQLRLPSFAVHCERLAEQARQQAWDPLRYLAELAEVEAAERADRRVARLAKAARLPRGKTPETLELARLPGPVRGHLPRLCEGHFLADASNLCIFGNPGTGKTHLMAALGAALVQRGHATLFAPARALTERLAAAKRELRLSRERLDRFACLLLDDIGYVRQDRAEMEVLFELLAQRYERRSAMLTAGVRDGSRGAVHEQRLGAGRATEYDIPQGDQRFPLRVGPRCSGPCAR